MLPSERPASDVNHLRLTGPADPLTPLPPYPGELAKHARPRDEDDDDDADDRKPKPKAGGGMSTGLIIGLVAGVFILLGCCVVGGVGIALVVPAISSAQSAAARTNSINNLKQIGLAMHNYQDAHRSLPFNGDKPAKANNALSGSWAFQIMPFMDQAPYFSAAPTPTTVSIAAYLCPGRKRSTGVTTGASTDYMFNLCLNNQAKGGTPSQTNNKITLFGVQDGTANTIFVGHGQISTADYKTANLPGFADTINNGGTFGTARGDAVNASPKQGIPPAANFGRDPAGPATANAWGGPFSQGALMCMGDATVRMFPYTTANLGGFLTPNNGEALPLPDF